MDLKEWQDSLSSAVDKAIDSIENIKDIVKVSDHMSLELRDKNEDIIDAYTMVCLKKLRRKFKTLSEFCEIIEVYF